MAVTTASPWQDPEFSATYPSDILSAPAGGASAAPAPTSPAPLPGAGGLAPDTLPGSVTVFTGAAKTPAELAAIAQNDPSYLQQLQWAQQGYSAEQAGYAQRAAALQASSGFDAQAIAQAQASAQGSASRSLAALGVSDAAAAAQEAAERERSARAHTRDLLTLHEIMAGRGIAMSGQEGVETNEQNLQYQELLKQLQLAASGRAAESGLRRADIQADLADRLASLGLQSARDKSQLAMGLADIGADRATSTANYTRLQGGLLMDTFHAYSDPNSPNFIQRPSVEAIWSPSHGAYQASNGTWYDAQGNQIAAPPTLSEPFYLNS